MRRLIAIAIAVALSTTVAGQSIRLGRLADPRATDEVFVLRYFQTTTQEGYGTMPGAVVAAAQKATSDLAAIAVVGLAGGMPYGATDAGGTKLAASEVSWNALSVLRIKPALGRDFTEADARAGKVQAILTHAAWMSYYRGRPDAIGSNFVRTHTRHGFRDTGEIVGVLPPGVFAGTPELDSDTQVFVLSPDIFDGAPARENWYAPLIRPRPGVTVAQMQTALNTALARLLPTGGTNAEFGLRLESLRNPRR